MERRLAIYEKIKDTKLNKLTIKQGDVNVKLNLKKDLVNPDVEISEKALEMLEEYAKKNCKTAQSNEDQSIQNKIENQIEIEDKNKQVENVLEQKNLENKHEETCSPSKKVRFSFLKPIEQHSTDSYTDNTINYNNEINSADTFAVPLVINSGDTFDETQPVANEESKKELKCRLCKIKISNERALHEHVSRIHGGKGAFSLHKKENFKNATETPDEDYDSSEMDDLDSQDDTYLSSSSDKIKNDKPMLPRPNVAIRVAKVAYYNSKGTVNSQNPFKSSIFKNGGIRGNFFSQERLPLRSCKIKMKITSDLTQGSDDFLIDTHEIIKREYHGPNKTTCVQSCKKDFSKENLILNENEIKSFFKALLDYIPLNNVIRLDDLIKENEMYLADLKSDHKIDTAECIRFIYQTILNSKQLGINLCNLKAEVNNQMENGFPLLKMKLLKNLLGLLVDNHLVIAVGVVERVYVAHEFKKHWVIESYKNQKGRGFFDDDESIIEENDETQDSEHEIETPLNSRPMRSTTNTNNKEGQKSSKNFKPICIIPRPWRYIDGLLNRPVLKKMLESTILYLKSNPNASFTSISSHFCPVLQPIMTLELLEMLEKLKCIQKISLKNESKCDLFSDFNNGSRRIFNEDEMNGDELHNYYLNQNSIFNIKKVFPN